MGSGVVLPDHPAHAGVYLEWSNPITRHFQPLGSPHSISLPSPSFSPPGILWSHMGLGSGWRESIHLVPSSPEETQGENPTVRRIHGPAIHDIYILNSSKTTGVHQQQCWGISADGAADGFRLINIRIRPTVHRKTHPVIEAFCEYSHFSGVLNVPFKITTIMYWCRYKGNFNYCIIKAVGC